ncbi:peptidase dimerization domain-containing protein, partial [[Brevibacterium] frigoritolerans]|nr:peptidase dimerization domain-containing protein [Peribacillus frigoritolerans]
MAAHSDQPEKGRSAIEEIGHKIIALHRLNDQQKGISVNVGKIEGGSAVNDCVPCCPLLWMYGFRKKAGSHHPQATENIKKPYSRNENIFSKG